MTVRIYVEVLRYFLAHLLISCSGIKPRLLLYWFSVFCTLNESFALCCFYIHSDAFETWLLSFLHLSSIYSILVLRISEIDKPFLSSVKVGQFK